jgi:hypothetical protein
MDLLQIAVFAHDLDPGFFIMLSRYRCSGASLA